MSKFEKDCDYEKEINDKHYFPILSKWGWRYREQGEYEADLVCSKGSREVTVELKTEKRLTKNLALEHISNKKTGRGGWMRTLDEDYADFLFYTLGTRDPKTVRFFIVRVRELQEWFSCNENSLRECPVGGNSEQHNETWIRLAPIDRLLKECPTFKEMPLDDLGCPSKLDGLSYRETRRKLTGK